MSKVIAQRALRNQNAAIMAAVAAGQSFVVTRNGAPVAELRPIAPGRRTFVARATVAEAAMGSPHIDAAIFEADVDRVIEGAL